jgi:hypothetical protein
LEYRSLPSLWRPNVSLFSANYLVRGLILENRDFVHQRRREAGEGGCLFSISLGRFLIQLQSGDNQRDRNNKRADNLPHVVGAERGHLSHNVDRAKEKKNAQN